MWEGCADLFGGWLAGCWMVWRFGGEDDGRLRLLSRSGDGDAGIPGRHMRLYSILRYFENAGKESILD